MIGDLVEFLGASLVPFALVTLAMWRYDRPSEMGFLLVVAGVCLGTGILSAIGSHGNIKAGFLEGALYMLVCWPVARIIYRKRLAERRRLDAGGWE